MQVVSVCVVAYVAGVVILAAAPPIAYTAATLTITSWVPAYGNHSLLDSQSAFSSVVVPANNDDTKHLRKTFNLEPAASLSGSFLIRLFRVVTFAGTETSSGSFPGCHVAHVLNSTCSGNNISNTDCKNHAGTLKPVSGRQQSMAEKPKNGSCRRPAPPSQRTIFSNHLSSVDKLILGSEGSIHHGITSALSDSHNASLLSNVRTLLELL